MRESTSARGKALGILTCACLALGALPAKADPAAVSVELNKLETQGNGCRSYLVVQNDSATAFESYKLDIVLFGQDGIVNRRFAMDLAPLKAQKRSVKLFDLDNVACDKIGSFLINDIVECKAASGPLDDCFAGLKVKSLANVQLTK